MLQKIQILFMSLCTLFGPERNFGRKGIDWEEQRELQRRGAHLGAYIKISNSAGDVGSKGGPGFALWEQQGFGRVGFTPFVSMLLSIVSLPSLPDPSVTKQRLVSWCQCASSSDFRELWVRLLMRNLELSCLHALPAHFPELSSHHCMRDLMSSLAESFQPWNVVRMQVSSCTEPLERAGCKQSQTSKAAAKREISAAAGSDCDQDKAAVVEFKNEASRLEFLLCFFPSPSFFLGLIFFVCVCWCLEVQFFFLFPPPHSSFFPAAPKAGCRWIPPG